MLTWFLTCSSTYSLLVIAAKTGVQNAALTASSKNPNRFKYTLLSRTLCKKLKKVRCTYLFQNVRLKIFYQISTPIASEYDINISINKKKKQEKYSVISIHYTAYLLGFIYLNTTIYPHPIQYIKKNDPNGPFLIIFHNTLIQWCTPMLLNCSFCIHRADQYLWCQDYNQHFTG